MRRGQTSLKETIMDELMEHEYLVYDQDDCIGSVYAVSDAHAVTVARAKFHFTVGDSPIIIVRKEE